MTKENDYKTSSGSELQDKFRNTVSIPQNIRGELAKAGDTIRDAEQTAATALALTFSSVGIVKGFRWANIAQNASSGESAYFRCIFSL